MLFSVYAASVLLQSYLLLMAENRVGSAYSLLCITRDADYPVLVDTTASRYLKLDNLKLFFVEMNKESLALKANTSK